MAWEFSSSQKNAVVVSVAAVVVVHAVAAVSVAAAAAVTAEMSLLLPLQKIPMLQCTGLIS